MALVVYNTLTRRKEPFQPLEPGKVRMYVCGPTVYSSCHLGHARHGVVWDTIRRYLEYAGFRVTYVVNITDVDDKIIDRARKEGVSWQEITSRYIPEYLEQMAALRVQRPTYQPRATEHISDMIRAVRELIDKGYAYVVEGSVYFSVARFPGYGKLSRRTPDDETVARVDPDPHKHHPADFALWKAAKEGEPSWDSPWGKGRPGWHIECSVMSAKYLGTPFDIHGGGEDLIFPHHENEIAQAEALTGGTFARYWMHNGFITVDKEKMSKSLGNVVNLGDLLRQYTGPVLRLFLLKAHYRSPVEFSPEAVADAAAGLDRIYNCLEAVDRRLACSHQGPTQEGDNLSRSVASAREEFSRHMDDDFNTAGALSAVFDLVRCINQALESGVGGAELGNATMALRELLGVLGLPSERERPGIGGLEDALIELLISARAEARKARLYALGDRIREGLAALGIALEDLPNGTTRAVRRLR